MADQLSRNQLAMRSCNSQETCHEINSISLIFCYTFRKICRRAQRGKIIFPPRFAAQHGHYTPNLLPTPMSGTDNMYRRHKWHFFSYLSCAWDLTHWQMMNLTALSSGSVECKWKSKNRYIPAHWSLLQLAQVSLTSKVYFLAEAVPVVGEMCMQCFTTTSNATWMLSLVIKVSENLFHMQIMIQHHRCCDLS